MHTTCIGFLRVNDELELTLFGKRHRIYAFVWRFLYICNGYVSVTFAIPSYDETSIFGDLGTAKESEVLSLSSLGKFGEEWGLRTYGLVERRKMKD